MKITIDVTQEDINKGIKTDVSRCPVAKALRRAIEDAKNVSVGNKLTFNLQGVLYYADVPLKILEFINKFDSEGKKAVKPTKAVVNFKTPP